MIVMKAWRRGERIIMGLILACLCSGCVALAVGAAGGVAGAVYVMGKLQEELNHPIAAVHEATLQGLRDLDLPSLKTRRTSWRPMWNQNWPMVLLSGLISSQLPTHVPD